MPWRENGNNFEQEKPMNVSVTSGPVRTAIEISIYLLIVLAIVIWCLQIVSPFIPFILWGAVIAVALHAPFVKLRRVLGGRNKLAVFLFAALGLAVFIVPAWLFGGSIIDGAEGMATSMETGEFALPPPNESIKSWPMVGEKFYANWASASANFEDWLEAHNEQVKTIAQRVVAGVAGLGLSLLQLIASVLIAAAMLANSEAVQAGMGRLARRLVGDAADEFLDLSSATIRSITVGVLGIAFIQAVAGGVGMALIGVPFAGIWALLILVLAIAQLPPLVVLLPAIIYVFSTNDNTTAAVIFTLWSALVSISDAFLKPLLLGRGVEAPMLVILLGAIGGMIHSGIIGLFLGAVILALGYKLFLAWMESGEEPQAQEP
jgi:predicted PurR-regulated permease PerM